MAVFMCIGIVGFLAFIRAQKEQCSIEAALSKNFTTLKKYGESFLNVCVHLINSDGPDVRQDVFLNPVFQKKAVTIYNRISRIPVDSVSDFSGIVFNRYWTYSFLVVCSEDDAKFAVNALKQAILKTFLNDGKNVFLIHGHISADYQYEGQFLIEIAYACSEAQKLAMEHDIFERKKIFVQKYMDSVNVTDSDLDLDLKIFENEMEQQEAKDEDRI